MKTFLKYLLASITPIFLYLFFGGIFNGRHSWMIPATLITITLTSLYYSKKFNELKYLFFVSSLPILLIFIFSGSINGFSRIWSYIIFIPISILTGIYLDKKKVILVITSLSVFYFILGLFIYPNIFVYFNNKGSNIQKEYSKITLVDKENKPVFLNTDKVIVLDFWNTSCGICFKKFPEFEKYYLKYKNNSKVEFYSINVPLKRDHLDITKKLVDSLNYKFPTLFSISKEESEKNGIYSYPHLLILKKGKVRYSGPLITEKEIIINHIDTEISNLLNE